jgi:hypothetical protein
MVPSTSAHAADLNLHGGARSIRSGKVNFENSTLIVVASYINPIDLEANFIH